MMDSTNNHNNNNNNNSNIQHLLTTATATSSSSSFTGMEEAARDGRYRLLRQIGGGAGGIVWSARSRERREKVAVKRVSNVFRDTDTAKRTLREIRLLRHFRHDNIIAIHDIVPPLNKDTFSDIFIVYELMTTNLHKIITSPHPLPDDTTQLLIYQILRGLKCIHSAGVLHRDLKPTNLLVNERCDLKICDFGCGRASANTRTGLKMTKLELVATRWYRAPEGLLSSGDYTTAVDVWSVGCIMAELLGRKVLFPGRTDEEQIELIIQTLGTPSDEEMSGIQDDMYREQLQAFKRTEGQSLEDLLPNASPEALELLKRTLHFDPAKRITVTEALRHPYLAKWHCEDDEPVSSSLFRDEFGLSRTREDFRELLYHEALDMRKGAEVDQNRSLSEGITEESLLSAMS